MLNPLNLFSKFIKSSNQRELDKIEQIVKKINSLEESTKKLADSDFPKKTLEFDQNCCKLLAKFSLKLLPRRANAAKDYEDFNPDQPDIIQKFVKSRDDWWSSESPFPGAPVARGSGDSPVDALVQLPLPAYFWLLSATVGSIAFVGCIFQLFYNVPRAPVLGVPLTSVILVASGPAFVFFFLVAIARSPGARRRPTTTTPSTTCKTC